MKKNKKIILTILILMEIVMGYTTIKTYQNKNIDTVKEESNIKKDKYAMYVDNGDGYHIYNENKFPSITEYVLDKDKSNCVDNNDNEIINQVNLKRKNKLDEIFTTADWFKYSSLATNGCRHIGKSHIYKLLQDNFIGE